MSRIICRCTGNSTGIDTESSVLHKLFSRDRCIVYGSGMLSMNGALFDEYREETA